MPRVFVALTLGGLGLALAALACGAPAEIQPDSPSAQATNVRRTAVAVVQGIIANKPTATAAPEATATPMPSCQNAIWWTDARSHVGEARVVQGTVVGSRSAPGGTTLVELGQPFPDPLSVVVAVPSTSTPNLTGRMVCVGGRISVVEGRPSVQVTDPSQIVPVN